MPTAAPLTDAVAEFVAGARLEDVPPDVVAAAKEHILDTLACGIGGAALTPSRSLTEVLVAAGGAPEATVLGTGRQLPRLAAAYVNSYACNALDFDDTHVRRGHPGSSILPPVLACAEADGRAGADLQLAVVVGYEVGLRLTAAMTPSRERYAVVSGLATRQVFGPIAAVAKLMGFDAGQTAQALGLGAVHAPVPGTHKMGLTPSERPISWVKNNYAAASAGAVLGCNLAAQGFLGSPSILDGPRGFWAMAGRTVSPPRRRSTASARLTCSRRRASSPTPAAAGSTPRSTRQRTSGASGRRRPRRSPASTCGRSTSSWRFWGVRPRNVYDAQYDLPYVLALELLGRSSGRGLSERDLADPEVLALCNRTTLHHDPAADCLFYEKGRLPAQVAVCFADGQVVERAAEVPTGDPGGPPFGREAVVAKAFALVEPRLGAEAATRLVEVALALEHHRVPDLVEAARA